MSILMFVSGVRRSMFDNKGNFSIFDAPKTPYSTFNFQYSNEAFDRLHDLMEFNTLLHIDVRMIMMLASSFYFYHNLTEKQNWC